MFLEEFEKFQKSNEYNGVRIRERGQFRSVDRVGHWLSSKSFFLRHCTCQEKVIIFKSTTHFATSSILIVPSENHVLTITIAAYKPKRPTDVFKYNSYSNTAAKSINVISKYEARNMFSTHHCQGFIYNKWTTYFS